MERRKLGKYTGATEKSGHCKYGGWNRDGMARFNEFHALVKEDRACPQATKMERELVLEFCKAGAPMTDVDGVVAVGQGGNAAIMRANLEPPVEAVWDIEEV